MFGSTYVCEQFFSMMKLAKNDKRSRISQKHLRNQLNLAYSNLSELEIKESASMGSS